MTRKRNWELMLSVIIIVITIILMIAYYNRWFSLAFQVGPFRAIHHLAWIGTMYIAITVPIIALIKKRHLKKYKALLRAHVFGNLIAFLLISLHFAGQIGRPIQFYPDLGTGLALYIIMIFLVATGLIQRFNIAPKIPKTKNKSLHTSLLLPFYIIIIIHILHGLGII
jgi:Kef-type K+ transport system membrane component KefB